jgi:pimeloyl-ACP methyl ester carboxylesterase
VRHTILTALLILASCSTSREARLSEAEAIARAGGLEPHVWRVGPQSILGFNRPGSERHVLVVYIEGDGHAWIDPWRPSTDPTPTDPIALRLAAADPARPLVYLARPCQYLSIPGCHNLSWTSERLSPAVVETFQQIIDDARRVTGADRIGLVGYSGGGALATLIAERRQDVAWLITVAANLDLAEWVRLQDIEPLSGSLDPAAGAKAIERLPQVHFAGADDPVVPPMVLSSFFARLPPNPAARLVLLPGFDHVCCWAEAWPRLLDDFGFGLSRPSGAASPDPNG